MIFSRYINKIGFLVLLFILFSIKTNFAQDGKAYDEITLVNCFFTNLYNFSFREADSLVAVISKTDMDTSTIFNIKANLAWWKLLTGEAIENNLKICNSNIDESIHFGLKNKSQDIKWLLNIIYAYSLKSRLENYRGNTLKSLFYFYISIDYIKSCVGKQDKDEKISLVLGLYFYFIDYIENEHFMMSALFFSFPDGDKIKGLKYLEDCSISENEMIRTEANYFLLKIYTNTEINYSKAFRYAQILTQQHPNNLVYSLELLKLMLILKKSSEAEIFQKKLIGEIQATGKISNLQKNHFISQIQELTKTGTQF